MIAEVIAFVVASASVLVVRFEVARARRETMRTHLAGLAMQFWMAERDPDSGRSSVAHLEDPEAAMCVLAWDMADRMLIERDSRR